MSNETTVARTYIPAAPGWMLITAHVDASTGKAALAASPIVSWQVDDDIDGAKPIALHFAHGHDPGLVRTPEGALFDDFGRQWDGVARWLTTAIPERIEAIRQMVARGAAARVT